MSEVRDGGNLSKWHCGLRKLGDMYMPPTLPLAVFWVGVLNVFLLENEKEFIECQTTNKF